MNINSDLLISSKTNGTIYANDFKCKNLAPATGATTTAAGMNFTNSNGIISASGTATADIYYGLSNSIYVKAGITYTISASFGVYSTRFIYSNLASNIGLTYADLKWDSGTSKSFTPARDGMIDLVLYIHTGNGLNADNIALQVEEGNQRTSWTPYKEFNTENSKNFFFGQIDINKTKSYYNINGTNMVFNKTDAGLQIPMRNLYNDINSNLFITNNNGDIQVLKPGYYMISVNLHFQYLAGDGTRWLNLYGIHNNNVDSRYYSITTFNGRNTLTLNSVVIRLSKDDIIRLAVDVIQNDAVRIDSSYSNIFIQYLGV